MRETEQDALIGRLVSAPPGEFGEPEGAARGEAAPDGAAGRDGSAARAGDPLASPTFTARERAILGYADRLTVEPASVSETDIAPLRAVGLDDRGIHDVCAIVSYFAFVNRMADGLGVELETDDREWRDGG